MPTYVYDFSAGNKDMADLLGGKGANLAEMTNLGLPVPPGFVISTEACRTYLRTGSEPPRFADEVDAHLHDLERTTGRKLGQVDQPLLVAVRSGGRYSMPGMMETVLNIGLTDASVAGLAAWAGNERLAWDSYRRLVQMFGQTVLGVPAEHFADALAEAKRAKNVTNDLGLDAEDLKQLTTWFKDIVREETGRDFPQDPRTQLSMAIRAVFESWHTERARVYRRSEHIPDDLGTAVTVCAMVFGNVGEDSGTGVAFTRDPATGLPGVYGDYLTDAQGEDVVSGIRNTLPLTELARLHPGPYAQLMDIMHVLEQHYRDLCDIEFTIERGKLWMLQTRVGKRTAAAAFRIASALVDEGLIDEDEALRRVDGAQLTQLMFPRFAEHAARPVTLGVGASPGAAVGKAVFDSATAVERARAGESVIQVRTETNPDDLDGMIHARGVLTGRGGKTSHAAVVARGLGRTCVCGADELLIDPVARRFTLPNGDTVVEGDVIAIDGTTGAVYLGDVPVVDSPVVEYFEGRRAPDSDDLIAAVHRILSHADWRRILLIRANADTPADAARARRFGAEGVGLCRTEHMFLGARRPLVERLILAESDADRDTALAALLPPQRDDFIGILSTMDGLPVTIRLLDPPLHEFLPDRTELSAKVAVAQALGHPQRDSERLLRAVNRLHEQNPMLGLRGVRLGLVIPGLYDMQVRAIAEATAARITAGAATPDVEIMIPLVSDARELQISAERARRIVADVAHEAGHALPCRIGTMIELPRAALTAGEIAGTAEFFSFGTNDLTQTTWGMSRDDVEAAFFPQYLDQDIFPTSPFETLDMAGVGRLMAMAIREGRAARPDLTVGVCGEHGGDPESIRHCHDLGLDYVSCSPFRVPVARLSAGRAVVLDGAVQGAAV